MINRRHVAVVWENLVQQVQALVRLNHDGELLLSVRWKWDAKGRQPWKGRLTRIELNIPAAGSAAGSRVERMDVEAVEEGDYSHCTQHEETQRPSKPPPHCCVFTSHTSLGATCIRGWGRGELVTAYCNITPI